MKDRFGHNVETEMWFGQTHVFVAGSRPLFVRGLRIVYNEDSPTGTSIYFILKKEKEEDNE